MLEATAPFRKLATAPSKDAVRDSVLEFHEAEGALIRVADDEISGEATRQR
jgi:hypothetical protein